MRRLIVASLAVVGFLLMGCERESHISHHNVPVAIATYIKTHFGNYKIIKAVKDTEGINVTYDIDLEGGYKLEFDSNYKIIDIEGITPIPHSTIPAPLLTYATTHYPNHPIMGWELKRGVQKLQLTGDVDLIFNLNGDFVGVD